jgi:protein gp37
MAINSKIEWTGNTWNPVTGCTKVSEGCAHCYAEKMANRLKLMGNAKYANGFEPTLHPHCLSDPLKWKKPAMVFVNSMSDLNHEDVPTAYIQQVFQVMNDAPQHVFQLLTKRPERFVEIAGAVIWTSNIWQGVTVESAKHTDRIELLRSVPAKTKFISFEPLLNNVGKLDLSSIDWAIVGGESGPRSRPIYPEWVANIKDQCEKQEVLFYFKQWGGTNKKKAGREFQGRTWDAIPEFSGEPAR